MSVKLDLHVHTISRGITYIAPEQLKEALIRRKLDGVAVTNFHDISHAFWLKNKLKDFIIIVGQEIWTKDGHILGLGLHKRVADLLSAEKTIQDIHAQGGIAIAAHPYFFLGVGKKTMSLSLDAIECFNGISGIFGVDQYLAEKCAKKRNIGQVASSDTTGVDFIGRSFTEIFTQDKDLILDSIRQGRTKLYKRALPIPFIFILMNLLNCKDIEPCSLHAVPCFICGRSMAVRIFKRECKCLYCGRLYRARILCSNGHYLCKDCIIKRYLPGKDLEVGGKNEGSI